MMNGTAETSWDSTMMVIATSFGLVVKFVFIDI